MAFWAIGRIAGAGVAAGGGKNRAAPFSGTSLSGWKTGFVCSADAPGAGTISPEAGITYVLAVVVAGLEKEPPFFC
jgi:hypothetical protein